MPEIYDNLTEETRLLAGLQKAFGDAISADICVGYFNLRGWRRLAAQVDGLPLDPGTPACRVLVGMSQPSPSDELREELRILPSGGTVALVDNQTAKRREREAAETFRTQLAWGMPKAEDERALRKLADQLREGRVRVKLFTRHQLHAKLYLIHRRDLVTRRIGYLGSSNLTFPGLQGQGELNIDVPDGDATAKLARWFQDRWDDRFCLDITDELITIIDESWARRKLVPPYHVYLKMAYHLSQDAREGLQEFRIPKVFGDRLFDFQVAAVKIAARHLNRRGGVLIGDVVGLGKTMMATALARLMQEDQNDRTLILCPKNLEEMWNWYREEYGLDAKVVSFSRVENELPDLRRYELVLIDESHNLRNPEGKRYAVIRDYITRNDARCILLSATPYNKHYLDLGAQIRLFVPVDDDIGIRPEAAIREAGGDAEFSRRNPNVNLRTLAAFQRSESADDWRDLMRRYLVRRTRSFIQQHYAETDEQGRRFLRQSDGTLSYFPKRVPKTVPFALTDGGRPTTYARLVGPEIVNRIDALTLPRYGLGTYLIVNAESRARGGEAQTIANLSRAGVRLKGFCRTNLFKRLESSGSSFLLSVERHALRNIIFLHALENDLPLPIGDHQYADVPLDGVNGDQDLEATLTGGSKADSADLIDSDEQSVTEDVAAGAGEPSREALRKRAAQAYASYAGKHKGRFKWLRPELFNDALRRDLAHDTDQLIAVLETAGPWQAGDDPKLTALRSLITDADRHGRDKVLVFTQFADTANYLEEQLRGQVEGGVAAVTGAAANPTALARRFSPKSNNERPAAGEEIRVLITTDVLSEGQNLQDCHVVVNFDLPWAIIRLIQRVGRVDRIGQQAETIFCHSFLPEEGIESLINLRKRVRARLTQNAEVVGADEVFFEDDAGDGDRVLVDLYNERAEALEDEGDDEDVDLASYALQIWQNATEKDKRLAETITRLPAMIAATKDLNPTISDPEGVMLFVRSGDGTDALVRVDEAGEARSFSPLAILKAAACRPDTPARERRDDHYGLVEEATRAVLSGGAGTGGTGLGRPSDARRRVYDRLSTYQRQITGSLLVGNGAVPDEIRRGLDGVLRALLQAPLRDTARASLLRQLRSGILDEALAQLVIDLQTDGNLVTAVNTADREPQIICSMGLRPV